MDSCVHQFLATFKNCDYVPNLCTFMLDWLTRVITLVQVSLQLSQLSIPWTAVFAVCAENTKFVVGAFHALIYFDFKFAFPATWATAAIPLDSLTPCVAEALVAIYWFIRITNYQVTYWAFWLICTWRWFNKFTVITSIGFLPNRLFSIGCWHCSCFQLLYGYFI